MNLSHAKFVIILKGENEKSETMSCDKFEKLFTQEDETELLEHIQNCEECRREYEKMQAVSSLVKEAKPLFKKDNVIRQRFAISMVAVATLFCLTGFLLLSWLPYFNYEQEMASEIYPTDEYGLVELY